MIPKTDEPDEVSSTKNIGLYISAFKPPKRIVPLRWTKSRFSRNIMDLMQKRTLGRTGWEISAIGFGAIKLPRMSREESRLLLNKAIDLGINYVDTADCYGDSEEKIGLALKARRREFYLSTKIDERDGTGVRKKLERCLHRLRTDWIDLIFFHDVRGSEYERIFDSGGLYALEKAREQGKIREVGISIHHSVPMMRSAVESGVFSVLMVAYSPLDEDRLAADLLNSASSHNVGVVAMKPLAGGRLAEIRPIPGQRHHFKGESMAQLCLHYILSNPNVTCAIPGMMKPDELEENLQVGRHPRELGNEEIRALMDHVGEAGKGFCRNCGYCLPCPEGIPVPDIFRYEGYYERYQLKSWAREQYALLRVRADACTACEQCMERCPYDVIIPRALRKAHRTLS
jgi:predicted aldo/keto reductase-like oxidoreductase